MSRPGRAATTSSPSSPATTSTSWSRAGPSLRHAGDQDPRPRADRRERPSIAAIGQEVHAMKALKTVAVALGITLARAHRHPARRPGRTVRLAEGHRGGRRGAARARSGRRLIDQRTAAPSEPRQGRDARRRPAGVGVSGGPAPPTPRPCRASATAANGPRSPSWASSSSWSSGRRNFIVVKAAIADPAAGRVHVPRGISSPRSRCCSLLRWREGAIRLPRRDACRIVALGVVGFGLLPDPVDGRAPDDPGRRLRAAHRLDARRHAPSSPCDRGRTR